MEILRLYQGYQGNQKTFFAPSSRRSINANTHSGNSTQNQIIKRIVTSRSILKRKKNPSDLITPDTLSFHLDKHRQALPKKRIQFSASIQARAGSSKPNLNYLKAKLKKSCDAATQNSSDTALEDSPYFNIK